ncbi:MAG: hypothetical protein J6Y03_00905 [Alphaproteobacteria bacterium]|nr:hypothetical protein [Alphaproteobacteria bacterium]
MNDLALSQLIFTRISHDLSGAMGAVYNGTELLKDDPTFVQEATDLIHNSAKDLMARTRFFRQTFGLPKDTDDTTKEYLKTFSLPFELKGVCTDNLQRSLIMTLTDYFYKGAIFEIRNNKILANGQALKDFSKLNDLLQTGEGEQTAANAPAFFAYHLSCQLQKNIKIASKELQNGFCVEINL